MICIPCKTAADKGQQGWKAHKKAGCKGKTSCTCMHRVGTFEELFNKDRINDSKLG